MTGSPSDSAAASQRKVPREGALWLTQEALQRLSPFHVVWVDPHQAPLVSPALRRAWGITHTLEPDCIHVVRPFAAPLDPALFEELTGMALTVRYTQGSERELRAEVVDLGDGRWMLACNPQVRRVAELEAAGLRLSDLPMYSGLGDALIAAEAAQVAYEESQQALQETAAANATLENVNEAFSRFVPRPFLQALGLASPLEATIGTHIGSVSTVMFTDLRNFTRLSEGLRSERIFALINRYLERVAPHVRANRGFVVHYLGDGLLALFASPAHGVRAGVAMEAELKRAIAEGAFADLLPDAALLEASFGLHHGRLEMGIVGEGGRLDSAIISDAVNVTARIEGLTRRFGCSMLISGTVRNSVSDAICEHIRRLGSFVVKGKSKPVDLFEVYTNDPPTLRDSKTHTRPLFDSMLKAWEAGDVEQALGLATQLVGTHPHDEPAHWWLQHLKEQLRVGVGPQNSLEFKPGVINLESK